MTKYLEGQPATVSPTRQDDMGSGTAGQTAPPAGWDYFGTNICHRGHLEFSEARDSAGDPLWERPLHRRNALVRLASQLDEARTTADTISETAGSPDVQRLITQALQCTLDLITANQATTNAVYQELVADGCSVERALDNAETRRKGRARR